MRSANQVSCSQPTALTARTATRSVVGAPGGGALLMLAALAVNCSQQRFVFSPTAPACSGAR